MHALIFNQLIVLPHKNKNGKIDRSCNQSKALKTSHEMYKKPYDMTSFKQNNHFEHNLSKDSKSNILEKSSSYDTYKDQGLFKRLKSSGHKKRKSKRARTKHVRKVSVSHK